MNVDRANNMPAKTKRFAKSKKTVTVMSAAASKLRFCNFKACKVGKLPKAKIAMISHCTEGGKRNTRSQRAKLSSVAKAADRHKNVFLRL